MKPIFAETNFGNYFSNVKEKVNLTRRSPVIKNISQLIYVKNISSYLSLEGIPEKFVVDYIQENMIELASTGPIYFEIILFEDFSRLYATYNQIIGSILLAEIETGTIPLYGRKYEKSVYKTPS